MLRAFFRFAVLGVLLGALFGAVSGRAPPDESPSGRSAIWNSARRLFGGRSQCGPPEACPPHHCRLDDAVVHGFCCGCAHPTDRVQVRCPTWLQCPLIPAPLCDDYNWMMDCCC